VKEKGRFDDRPAIIRRKTEAIKGDQVKKCIVRFTRKTEKGGEGREEQTCHEQGMGDKNMLLRRRKKILEKRSSRSKYPEEGWFLQGSRERPDGQHPKYVNEK